MFTVVLPTHDRGAELRQSVESILAQTFVDFELVIVDDASQTPADEFLGGLERDSRIRVVRLDRNSGVSRARNRGIEVSRGAYVAFLDDDDRFRPNKLERLADVFDSTNVDVVYHRMEIHFVREGFTYVNRPHPRAFTLDQLLSKNLLGSPTMVAVRRSAVVATGGFDADLPALEDFDLWIRLKRDGATFHYVHEVLADYRRDTDARSRSLGIDRDIRAWDRLHDAYRDGYDRFDASTWADHLQKIFAYRGFRALLGYRRVEAASWFARAAAARPLRVASVGLVGASLAAVVDPRLALRLQAGLKGRSVFASLYEPRTDERRKRG